MRSIASCPKAPPREPAEGGTLVRETWDITEERGKQLVRGAAKHTRQSMEQTLERIATLVTG